VRICCPRFCFWTDILRLLVSFPSPLQEVGILCVCLCLVAFLSDLILYRADVLVHSLCMIPKDALLFVRCCTYIYRFLSGSSALVLLRVVHVPSRSGPFPALDRGPPLFCCEGPDIFRVFIGLFLFRAICYSTCHLGTLLPCNISSFLLESLSCCVFIAFIAICKPNGGVSVTICKLSTGVVEYVLYILRRTPLWTRKSLPYSEVAKKIELMGQNQCTRRLLAVRRRAQR